MPDRPVVVRPWEPGDLEAVARLLDAYRSFYDQPSDLARARRWLAERTARGESSVLVAVSAGEPVGFAQLYATWCTIQTAPFLVLYDLFVAPASRARGVGRRLLDAAADLGRGRGACRLELSTARSNLVAQRLYESAGWERDEVFLTYALDL